VNDSIAPRLAAVRERIADAARAAGRDADAVTLVAVSKFVEPALIALAAGAGQRVFGENRAQELVAHADALAAEGHDVEWHFIGQLQRNKVRALAGRVGCWQSVDREELVTELAKRAPVARILVQVNIGDEPQKGGCAVDDTTRVVDLARDAGLDVRGLMTVPPAADDPRPFFARLRELGERLGLRELSMGMSGDYEAAIGEGATIVRVGTAIFGPRPGPPGARR
jgi:pyridoxal phosphate enzyme (YggS family)